MNLDQTIKHVKEVIKANDLRIEDKDILDISTRLFISNKIGEQKKENIQSMKEPIKSINKELGIMEKATDKQCAYLQELGYRGSYDLTKLEAQNIIREFKELKNKGMPKGGY
jgi:hypothetical protein